MVVLKARREFGAASEQLFKEAAATAEEVATSSIDDHLPFANGLSINGFLSRSLNAKRPDGQPVDSD